MPSVYISEKNYMAAYERAHEISEKTGQETTVKDVINQVLEEQLRVKPTNRVRVERESGEKQP